MTKAKRASAGNGDPLLKSSTGLSDSTTTSAKQLQFHPLADIFPLMEGVEFDELVADIKKHGPLERIVLYEGMILDGRNRYRALLAAGLNPADAHKFTIDGTDFVGDDPAAYVISANLHRRHLAAEQKRELIAKLLKANPEKSDREIGRRTKADKNTVASVRAKQEACGEIHHVEKRTDTKGRKQPAKKKAKAKVETPATRATESSDLSKEKEKLLGLCGFALLCDVDEPVELPPLDRDQAIQAIKTLKTGEARLQAFRRKMGALSGVAPDNPIIAAWREADHSNRAQFVRRYRKDIEQVIAEIDRVAPDAKTERRRERQMDQAVREVDRAMRGRPYDERSAARAAERERLRKQWALEDDGTKSLDGIVSYPPHITRVTTTEGNDTDAQASADKCREEFAALDDGSDPLDIPAFLRRTP